jgi:hypothetical protein
MVDKFMRHRNVHLLPDSLLVGLLDKSLLDKSELLQAGPSPLVLYFCIHYRNPAADSVLLGYQL